MKEEDVYDPLIDFFEVTFNPNWSAITHLKHLIQISDNPERPKAEGDICFGAKKNKQYELSDLIHVKTKENLNNKENESRKLWAKAQQTLNGSPKVWIAIEKSSYTQIKEDLVKEIGIIIYHEVGNKATNFAIQREAIAVSPKFIKHTNKFINKELGPELDNVPKFFVCSLNENAYRI